MAETPDPAEYDWTVPRGACETLAVDFADEDGNLIDLTGFGAEIEINWKDGTLVLSTEDSPPRVTITPGTWVVSAELTAEETADLPAGRLTKHRWWLIEPDGCRKVPLIGYIIGE